jgi:hypothetical protein
MTDFEHWWYHEGSQGPNGMDMEEHCKRMCKIAWCNGAFKERERAALKGYAGITIWGGDATVTKIFTEEEMKYAIDTRALINYAVQQCLDALTSHETKE